MSGKISVIIPTLNEAQHIPVVVGSAKEDENCEVLVVDGGSLDATCAFAAAAGARVIHSSTGRANQLNRGAREASGDLLLFLHGDSILPQHFGVPLRAALDDPLVAAGAFSLYIKSDKKILKFIAACANMRSRLLGLPYGDQAFFITASGFSDLGGFPQMEIMEDFVFIRNAAKTGKVVILPQQVVTSSRRWQNMGILRTTLLNQLIVFGYTLGVPPQVLTDWYNRGKGVNKNRKGK